MSVLYLTWDGPKNAYLESLYFPIFARLPRPVHVLQMSYASTEEGARTAAVAESLGIGYDRIAIPRWSRISASTAVGLAMGVRGLRQRLSRLQVELLIPRSTLPALVALQGAGDKPMLFDADGLPQDERVDFAEWSPTSPVYRLMRDAEMRALHRAVRTVTRTEAGKAILLARAGPSVRPDRIRVVPNGKDETQFAPMRGPDRAEFRQTAGLPTDGPLVIYCGSIGAQYEPEAMLAFFAAVKRRRPAAHLVLLTGHASEARAAIAATGVDDASFTVRSVPPDAVPAYLASADVGIAFRRPSFSQRAVCPIKVGEYLLCGLPIVANAGVGDLDAQLADCSGAFVGPSISPAVIDAAAEWFVEHVFHRPEPRDAARERGLAHFSLERAVEGYGAAIEAATAARG